MGASVDGCPDISVDNGECGDPVANMNRANQVARACVEFIDNAVTCYPDVLTLYCYGLGWHTHRR